MHMRVNVKRKGLKPLILSLFCKKKWCSKKNVRVRERMDELLKTIFGMVAIALGGLVVMLFFLWIISLLSGPKKEEEGEEEEDEKDEKEQPEGNTYIIVWGILFICGGLILFFIGYNNLSVLKDNLLLIALSSKDAGKEMNKYLFFEILGAILTVIGVILVLVYFQKNKKIEYPKTKRKKDKCPYCKTKLDKDDDFCSKCGRKV